MDRQQKIQTIKTIQAGGKIGELLNFGVWLWWYKELDGVEDEFYICETPFKDLKIARKDFDAYTEQIGGKHLVMRKTYSSKGASGGPVTPTEVLVTTHKEVEVIKPKEEQPKAIEEKPDPVIIEPEPTERVIRIRDKNIPVDEIAWEDIPFQKWINRKGR